MPEIEITEDQHEYLQALREDIKQDVVGRYAHVRMVDAVQYLIDNHEGEINATVTEPADGPAASGVGAGAGSVDDGASNPTGDAADGAAAAGDDAGASSDSGGTDTTDDSATDGGAAGAAPMSTAGGADDDGMLSAMMQLLETHDDKWQSVEGDTGYEVELPDGSAETANTRDDVRALLFRNYE